MQPNGGPAYSVEDVIAPHVLGVESVDEDDMLAVFGEPAVANVADDVVARQARTVSVTLLPRQK